jgi:hypothetical protein
MKLWQRSRALAVRLRHIAACFLLIGAHPGFAHADPAAPCCGPVTAQGRRLAAALDDSGVERLWQPHTHINWKTGEPDPARPGYAAHATHCSAFAASFADRLGIYLLRPPQHGQGLLANAQVDWLAGPGQADHWQQVDFRTAQALANRGWLVIATYANPDPHRPGHVAVIRPSLKSENLLLAHGPEETQVGGHNHLRTTIAHGFSSHPGAWLPGGGGGIRFYAHQVHWSGLPAS